MNHKKSYQSRPLTRLPQSRHKTAESFPASKSGNVYDLTQKGMGFNNGFVSNASSTVSNDLNATRFVASSASATSTFSGGLAVNTTGLVYDYSTGNVGIGTTAPGGKLDVVGTLGTFSVENGGDTFGSNAANVYIKASNASGALQFQTGGSNTRLEIGRAHV